MSLAQENLDSATKSAERTLDAMATHAVTGTTVTLGLLDNHALQSMAWDLEAIQAAIRVELNTRGGTDLG